jgi:acetolactate synthase-1/2/3 large subunit
LLVVGGQVKSEDLATGGIRQRGIQEIDGVALSAPVSKVAERLERPWDRSRFITAVRAGRSGRPGPVFLELCLDVQGAPVDATQLSAVDAQLPAVGPAAADLQRARQATADVVELTRNASRPLWLIGGGVTRETALAVHDDLVATGIPVMTTWNGADRMSRLDPTYVGRPNTWGQRSANLLISQADLVVVFGSRLGLQQTGFNWQQWATGATVVQIDIDIAELSKGHPKVSHAIHADANELLRGAVEAGQYPDRSDWLGFCREVRDLIPIIDPANTTAPGFVSPFEFYASLAQLTKAEDLIVPCSSGGANSVAMQTFEPIAGQVMITDKGLASMGYGLGGAIGAAMAWPGRRTVLIEGDGGFTQNLQELATVAVNRLPIKIFIFANNGYGSIRTTQRNYFGGAYLGCDTETGLGFPDWPALFQAYGITSMPISDGWTDDVAVRAMFDNDEPAAFIVPIDPDQTYWPKITSRVTATGSMESNPLHQMSPDLSPEVAAKVLKYSS